MVIRATKNGLEGGAVVNLTWQLGFLTFSRFDYTGLKFGASTR